jgi:hypothetical protein
MKSVLRALSILAILSLAATLSHAAAGVVLRPESKLWLEGKSTVHEYSSKATKLDATFDHDPALLPPEAVNGEAVWRLIRAKGIRSMDVVIPVADLHSGKTGLDRNLQKALLAPQHPGIRFHLASYELAEGAPAGTMKIDAKGTVTVAGVQRDLRMAVTAVREGDAVRVRGGAPLLMSQFGIKPPTMMMGTLRTSDEVTIHFDLLLATGKVDAPVAHE